MACSIGLKLLVTAVAIGVVVAANIWPPRAFAEEVAPSVAVESVGNGADLTFSDYLDARSKAIRAHVEALITALPHEPAEFRQAGTILSRELDDFGWGRAFLSLAFFVALGFALERALWRAVTGNWRSRWKRESPIETVSERLRIIATRFGYGIASWVVFTLGSVGGFLAVDWPPRLGKVALAYLVALSGFRGVMALSQLALVPHLDQWFADELRIIPARPEVARRAHLYVGRLAGWFAFGKATVENLSVLGFSLAARQLVAYVFGIGLLAIALHAVWRSSGRSADGITVVRQLVARTNAWLWSAYFVLLWLLWVASALPTLWLCATVGTVWAAVRLTRRAVAHLTRAPGTATFVTADAPSMAVICVERAIRALLIIGGAVVLVRAWNLNLAEMAAGDTPGMRAVGTALDILIIGLAADLVWNILKTLIERQLGTMDERGGGSPGEVTSRQARLRTLLPIAKKLAAVVIVFIAAMLMLSEAGVRIGPLIAGAGVIGLAVSFGAQTLVRDIFSGFFYLLDDAFRVGEYIQSGNYKGTVESFSIRSVRLRHHRGPLYTVPFGALGAIQNMSRDWVIDILTVGVSYDTDLDAVKKIVKEVGRQLMSDRELAPLILSPLKMQGIQQFGDFAIQIRMKMTTRPGEQFIVRRRAYALIKKEFDSAGIKFAFPTVQVAGGGEAPVAAAARQVLDTRGAAQSR